MKAEPRGVSSAQVPSATVISNFIGGLWEASHQREILASLGTTVYRVVRWLTLGISRFPSWPQLYEVVLLSWQQPYNSSTSRNVQFWHLPGRYDPGSRSSRGVSECPGWPNSPLLYKCQVVLAHCSCSTGKNIMSAHSEITRRSSQGDCITTVCFYVQFLPASTLPLIRFCLSLVQSCLSPMLTPCPVPVSAFQFLHFNLILVIALPLMQTQVSLLVPALAWSLLPDLFWSCLTSLWTTLSSV